MRRKHKSNPMSLAPAEKTKVTKQIIEDLKKLRKKHRDWSIEDAVAHLANKTMKYTPEWEILNSLHETTKKKNPDFGGSPKSLDEAITKALAVGPLSEIRDRIYYQIKDWLAQKFGVAMADHQDQEDMLLELFETIVKRNKNPRLKSANSRRA